MEAAPVSARTFDRLRVHSIGLPQVLFQSITHMAPAAAVAYSIYISVPFSQQALALSVLLALVACLCAAVAIGQLAKLEPSAGGLYAYAARSLGPPAGFILAWLFILFEPLVAPFLYLEFGWAMREVISSEAGWHYTGQWWIWATLMAAIVLLLTYRDIRISTTAGVIIGARDRPLLRPLRLRVGLRRGLRQLRDPSDRRRPVAQPGQGLLVDRLGRRLPRHLQLDRRQLERGGERRDARHLRARPEPPRAAPARAHPPAVQDAARRDHLDDDLRARGVVRPRLEVGPARRVRVHRHARRDRRRGRLHPHLLRLHLALLDEAAGPVQPAPAPPAAPGGG